MNKKIIFSFLAVFLFFTGAFFVWRNQISTVNQMPIENHSKIPRLVEARKETPLIKSDLWKEQHPDRIQWAGYYSKDADGVYWHHMKIIDADPNTFDAYNDQYAHDSRMVFYQGYSVEGFNDLYAIVGADVASFQAFEDGYAKDEYFVYFRGEVIPGADAETFVSFGPIDVPYAKDKHVVYRENERIDGFEPSSFRIVDKSSRRAIYLADDKRVGMEVWFSDDQVGTEEIPDADPATFEVVAGWWSKDKNNVFYKTKALENADTETFTVFGKWEGEYIDQLVYAKDKENVYFLENRIPAADAVSFEQVEEVRLFVVFNNSYGRDKDNAYIGADVFPKEDLDALIKGKIPPNAKPLGNNKYLYLGKTYIYSTGGHEPPNLSPVTN